MILPNPLTEVNCPLQDEKKPSASLSNLSTVKALSVIELLAARGKMRLIDIADKLNMNTSTALRFLSALQSAGYVMQDQDSMRYALTYKICRVAALHNSRTGIYDVTHPCLARLTEKTRESTCISVEQNLEMVYVDVAPGPAQALMSRQMIGGTAPMHCTGNGKLILATYTEAELDRFLREKGLPRLTEHTITDTDALRAELERVRAQGYAVDDEECESGLRCVAVGLRDYTGRVMAGLSVTGPTVRVSMGTVQEYLPLLQEAAAQISARLGYEED